MGNRNGYRAEKNNQETCRKKRVAKKKVAKKRVVRRKVVAVGTLVERATDRGAFSETNKLVAKQYKKTQTANNQANRKVESARARVEKVAAAAGNAKSVKQKDSARTRLAAAKAAVREAIVLQRMAVKEEKTAVALLGKLDKLHDKAYAAFVKNYEKAAKAAAKPRKMKRRVARKKVVKKV